MFSEILYISKILHDLTFTYFTIFKSHTTGRGGEMK